MFRKILSVFVLCLIASGCVKGPKPSELPLAHTVQFPGETVAIISKWYTENPKNYKEILAFNPQIKKGARLAIGDVVVIPRALIKREDPLPKSFVRTGRFPVTNSPGVSTGVKRPTVGFGSGPTPKATQLPSAQPTLKPTAAPTVQPTVRPTAKPTATPAPTALPTAKPTAKPTAAPERIIEVIKDEVPAPTLAPTKFLGVATPNPTGGSKRRSLLEEMLSER